METDRRYARLIAVGCRTLLSLGLSTAGVWLWILAGGPMRILTSIALVAFLVCLARYVVTARLRAALPNGLVLVALALSPVEISARTRPGLPGLVPYIFEGRAASPDLQRRAAKGDVVLGGCVSTGLEPRWVVVW